MSQPVSNKTTITSVPEHTVEIITNSGEGAQKCATIFGQTCAKMGNGVWTVEIIPAEIEPPHHTVTSTSGNIVRFGTDKVTNWGDRSKLAVAFNDQVCLSRHRLDSFDDDCIILQESSWEHHEDEAIRNMYAEAMEEMSSKNYRFIQVPIEEETLKVVDNPQHGKNMFALGMLAEIYQRDLSVIERQIAHIFHKKPAKVTELNIQLVKNGMEWARENLDFQFHIETIPAEEARVVMNGNQACALGAVAAGMEMCAMYPITPATSVSHELAAIIEDYGGIVHQAEDEIAAAGVALGASYGGKVALTVTSGPGMALKTEFLGLAIMTEIPLVVLNVQRGGPSTGLPTKVEQSDLLSSIYGQHGDAPRVVIAPRSIEECFHSMITARRIAETFRCVVIVLTDANLATGVQQFTRPEVDTRWQQDPIDFSPVPEGLRPYDWNPETGLSRRFVPGTPGGAHTVTGLAHDEFSNVSYHPDSNERGARMRARKLAVFQSTLIPPEIHGDDEGELMVVGWGSTQGAIEEAVDRARSEGRKVSTCQLTFMSPLEPGLKEIFSRFNKVMTVEINYSDTVGDPYITEETRRYGQLAWLLRAQTLVDVDCWTSCPGQPLRPNDIYNSIIAINDNGASQ
ncbi:MAG: 2-oxoacid:acceptor oxidoreductase subunit alpha [Gammaproteobacteria bacterium]|nr:2-oxoacid:acceptor oxidoreductase subunit alpha [Gammaproteobacteria bacterium]